MFKKGFPELTQVFHKVSRLAEHLRKYLKNIFIQYYWYRHEPGQNTLWKTHEYKITVILSEINQSQVIFARLF